MWRIVSNGSSGRCLGSSPCCSSLWPFGCVPSPCYAIPCADRTQLHFLLAVSNYYSHLVRHQLHQRSATSGGSSNSNSSDPSQHGTQLQRIYLLPRQAGQKDGSVEMVYAPVPLDSLPIEMQVQAMEAWVQKTSPPSSATASSSSAPAPQTASSSSRHHSHSHNHRRRSGSGGGENSVGRIRLPVQSEEPLLPPYRDAAEPRLGKA